MNKQNRFINRWALKRNKGKKKYIFKFCLAMTMLGEILGNFFIYLTFGIEFFYRDDILVRIVLSLIYMFILALFFGNREWNKNEKKFHNAQLKR